MTAEEQAAWTKKTEAMFDGSTVIGGSRCDIHGAPVATPQVIAMMESGYTQYQDPHSGVFIWGEAK